jgi:ribonuclease HI
VERVELWTDGACAGNPGPGGWAAILRFAGRERELSGGERHTTNNRMELLAALEGLRAISRPMPVVVHTDSAYVANGFVRRWIDGWCRRGWRTAGGAAVANRELWEALAGEVARHDVVWRLVRGHAGVELNERCDRLACAARDAAAGR